MPRGQKQGRRVREGAACECSGSSQLRQEGTRGPLSHSGGRGRGWNIKESRAFPSGEIKSEYLRLVFKQREGEKMSNA